MKVTRKCARMCTNTQICAFTWVPLDLGLLEFLTFQTLPCAFAYPLFMDRAPTPFCICSTIALRVGVFLHDEAMNLTLHSDLGWEVKGK